MNADTHMRRVNPAGEYRLQRQFESWPGALQAEVFALKRLQAETSTELDALLPALLDRAFNPDSETEVGARPPRALFSAPSRKTPAAGNSAEARNLSPAEDAGREGASSHARGGRAPRASEFGFKEQL